MFLDVPRYSQMFLDLPRSSWMILEFPRCSLLSSATSISDGIFLSVRSALHPIWNQALSPTTFYSIRVTYFVRFLLLQQSICPKWSWCWSSLWNLFHPLLLGLFIFDQWRAGLGTIDGQLHLLIFSWTEFWPIFRLLHFLKSTYTFTIFGGLLTT